MRYTVDRFQGELAVLLLRNDESIQRDVEIEALPADIQEGDIIDVQFDDEDKITSVEILKSETQKAKEKAESLISKLLNKNKE